jgi:formylglycine-generating enzyme required for sulfatase activity
MKLQGILLGGLALLVLLASCGAGQGAAGEDLCAAGADCGPWGDAGDATAEDSSAPLDLSPLDAPLDTTDEPLPLPACHPNCVAPEGLAWVPLAGGSFTMGCSEGDLDCDQDETPPHLVTLGAFEMLESEVTEGQFFSVMGFDPSALSLGSDYPVENLSWPQAQAFCVALGGRLPTEAQWEYAARAGGNTRFSCGAESACLKEVAWYDHNAGGTKRLVKTKAANAWGLYDLTGNVWEWVADWYDEGYYWGSAPADPSGPSTGHYRGIRGGAFVNYYFVVFLRVSNRFANLPGAAFDSLGFRCVRDGGL